METLKQILDRKGTAGSAILVKQVYGTSTRISSILTTVTDGILVGSQAQPAELSASATGH
jgi:hypothetical protein